MALLVNFQLCATKPIWQLNDKRKILILNLILKNIFSYTITFYKIQQQILSETEGYQRLDSFLNIYQLILIKYSNLIM